jgi:RNA polymerase-binding transcription factor DksA
MAINETLKEEMKKALSDEKTRLEEDLSKFATKTDIPGDYKTRFDDLGSDEDENTTEVEMYVDTIGVEESLEKELGGVNAALGRFETGTYGVCSVCGADIEEGRLRAYPAANTCMKCAK